MNNISGNLVAAMIPILLGLLSILSFLIYALFRLKSTRLIRIKIWRIIFGDSEYSDPVLQRFSRENHDIDRFRVTHGVDAHSVADLRKLITWMKRYGVSDTELRKVCRWVQPAEEKVLHPMTVARIAATATSTFIVYCLSAMTLFTTTSSTTLLTMRESHTSFLTDGYEVRSKLPNTWKFSATSCAKHVTPSSSTTGFNDREIGLICPALADGSFKKAADEGLKIQRRALVAISVILFITSFIGYTTILSTRRARILLNRVEKIQSTVC
ncbi:DUF6216 family protein [Robbsia sp. Bb-Pol-6]|uniref:DUF6216 family protein n=1 Tax=Robbsia betulipollinis TaxID=2981849 RepID=A0ABT3ZT33_9BURK|nr:DUF6216 family protein [Robbsia betulipollinis]MCY0389709.1 DUF6216 family protein [Robbsia betulipollinis]